VVVSEYGVLPEVREVAEPVVGAGAVVVKVEATGLCRSDWHGWMGHDSDIVLPHVPGHEFAGTIAAVGAGVTGWAVGDRVTAPFVCACGECEQCREGNQQVCPNQLQPGFNYWGSFAEYVAVPYAEVNLVRLPDELDFATAAGLGCRFATSFRAVRQVGKVVAGERVAVFGCGGVGLSAVMIAAAVGAEVIAIDTNPAALQLARDHGAVHLLQASRTPGPDREPSARVGAVSGRSVSRPASDDTVTRIRDLGGAHVTIDALGSSDIIQQALHVLRPRGRHVQVGLLPSGVNLDVGRLISQELSWLGSHGMPAHAYPELLELVAAGNLNPTRLVTRTITLDQTPAALTNPTPAGITIITP
jgi:alcohol dehydrogenase